MHILTTDERALLQTARDLIADEANWLKGCLALGGSGAVVNVMDDEAVHFCALGAVMRTCGVPSLTGLGGSWPAARGNQAERRTLTNIWSRVDATAQSLYDAGGLYVNNILGHEAILAVFDKVLADERIA